MIITPRSRSTPLAFPQVSMTRLLETSSRFALQTFALSCSNMASASSHTITNGNQLLHYIEQIAVPLLRAEGVVESSIKNVELRVNLVCLSFRFENFCLQTRHPSLCGGKIF